MAECIDCGGYTKYNNGKCYSCYNKNKSKAGKVYIGISKRKDGSEKIYTGQTKRSVYERVGEHIKVVKNPNSKTYTGKGTGFKLLGSIFSRNRFKAEKTIKQMSPVVKRKIAKKGAWTLNLRKRKR